MRMQPEDKPLISVLMGVYFHKQSVDGYSGNILFPVNIFPFQIEILLPIKSISGCSLKHAVCFSIRYGSVHNKRKMRHRWNEAVTRYIRFRELGLLPENLLYVLKPLAVGMLPAPLLGKLKKTFIRFLRIPIYR